MPAFDLEKMQKEDAEMEGLDAPYRFGKGFDVSYTLSDGLWQDIEGGRLWSLTFESEGAISLNYIFENMFLPEGASLYIINHDKTVVYGPVTSEVLVPKVHVRKSKASIVTKPVIRKIGKNYIEIAHLSDFEPEAFCVPASIKRHEVSPRVLRIAKLMKRVPIASIRRIGNDLTDI